MSEKIKVARRDEGWGVEKKTRSSSGHNKEVRRLEQKNRGDEEGSRLK